MDSTALRLKGVKLGNATSPWRIRKDSAMKYIKQGRQDNQAVQYKRISWRSLRRRRISVLCIDAAPNSFLAFQLAEPGGGVAKFLTSSPEE